MTHLKLKGLVLHVELRSEQGTSKHQQKETKKTKTRCLRFLLYKFSAACCPGLLLIVSSPMSKAFTRESDDLPDLPPLNPRQPSLLPPGAKNYVTSSGVRRLREELELLNQVERPRAAALPDASDARTQLHAIGQRIQHLQQSLESAVVVPPPAAPEDRVRFGATVTVRERGGNESCYRIVGIDETDLNRGWVSYVSPVAKALLDARLGDKVRFKLPFGEEELEILAVTYE